MITVTGSVSGRAYTTPVQPIRLEDRYVVLSQRHRRWWRNIATNQAITLMVRGQQLAAHATIADDDAARSLLDDCLTQQPRVAKFYGIQFDRGTPDASSIDELATRVVVIDIKPDVV